MSTTTIHIKTDIKTRDEAKKVAEGFGFSLTSLVNALLKQIARSKRLNLNLEEKPTQYMIDSMKQAEDDVKHGRVISFETPQDAIDYVSSMIDNDKKHKDRAL